MLGSYDAYRRRNHNANPCCIREKNVCISDSDSFIQQAIIFHNRLQTKRFEMKYGAEMS